MLTKQMRELERQATVVNQPNEHLIQLSDLNHYDDMYYVGDLVDLDGNNWVKKDMAQKITMPYRCIDSKLGPAQRASFAYFSQVHFAGFNEQNCDLLLTQGNRSKAKSKFITDPDFPGKWELIWEGQRAADNDEFFTLYKKREVKAKDNTPPATLNKGDASDKELGEKKD